MGSSPLSTIAMNTGMIQLSTRFSRTWRNRSIIRASARAKTKVGRDRTPAAAESPPAGREGRRAESARRLPSTAAIIRTPLFQRETRGDQRHQREQPTAAGGALSPCRLAGPQGLDGARRQDDQEQQAEPGAEPSPPASCPENHRAHRARDHHRTQGGDYVHAFEDPLQPARPPGAPQPECQNLIEQDQHQRQAHSIRTDRQLGSLACREAESHACAPVEPRRKRRQLEQRHDDEEGDDREEQIDRQLPAMSLFRTREGEEEVDDQEHPQRPGEHQLPLLVQRLPPRS